MIDNDGDYDEDDNDGDDDDDDDDDIKENEMKWCVLLDFLYTPIRNTPNSSNFSFSSPKRYHAVK